MSRRKSARVTKKSWGYLSLEAKRPMREVATFPPVDMGSSYRHRLAQADVMARDGIGTRPARMKCQGSGPSMGSKTTG